MKIVADKHIPYLKGILEYYGNVEYLSGAEFTPEAVKDADILVVRTVVRINQSLLAGSKVKLICTATIGIDHIDTAYCKEQGIKWVNAPGCNAHAVQQYILSSLILLSKDYAFNLKDKTIGVVGVGNVGSVVADSCELLGMRVLRNDPPREMKEVGSKIFSSLVKIQIESDIITFHTPLTKSGKYPTLHLASEEFFSSIKKDAFIINSARGAVVDTKAITKALGEEGIRQVVIDCWEDEPNINQDYLNRTCIGTPHIAGYSADGKANAARVVVEEIAKFANKSNDLVKDIKEDAATNPIIDLNEIQEANRIHEAILYTYSPLVDSLHLKSNPQDFKNQRNNYNFRREFRAYTIKNATKEEAEILSALGFNIA